MKTTQSEQDEEQRDRERDPAFDNFYCTECSEQLDECACASTEAVA